MITIKPEDKIFLDENYQHWLTLQSGYIAGLNIHQRAGMLRCIREYFWPGYTYDEWCPECVAKLVRHLYERYDKWIEEQHAINIFKPFELTADDKALIEEPVVVQATFPAHTIDVPVVSTIEVPTTESANSTPKRKRK